MIPDILNDVTGYIDFLRSNGYYVMFSCFSNYYGDCLPTLLEYEIHRVPICVYLKSLPKTHKMCVHCKRLLEKNLSCGTYYSHCYAGVEEYIYSIVYENKIIMRINISGFRGRCLRSEHFKNLTEKYSGKYFSELYQQLSENVPSEDEIKKFIRPLDYMIKELYKACIAEKTYESHSKSIFCRAIAYIYKNYMKDISCSDVAAEVSYSEPYLRHIFRNECGISIMEYINKVRLSCAAESLKKTNLNITQIAYACGFSNSNYFSTVFKKMYKLSPKDYRKQV